MKELFKEALNTLRRQLKVYMLLKSAGAIRSAKSTRPLFFACVLLFLVSYCALLDVGQKCALFSISDSTFVNCLFGFIRPEMCIIFNFRRNFYGMFLFFQKNPIK